MILLEASVWLMPPFGQGLTAAWQIRVKKPTNAAEACSGIIFCLLIHSSLQSSQRFVPHLASEPEEVSLRQLCLLSLHSFTVSAGLKGCKRSLDGPHSKCDPVLPFTSLLEFTRHESFSGRGPQHPSPVTFKVTGPVLNMWGGSTSLFHRERQRMTSHFSDWRPWVQHVASRC